MKNNKKIGWQKYEDYIEKQMSSPFLNNIIKTIITQKLGALDQDQEEEETLEEEDLDSYEDEEEADEIKSIPGLNGLLPLTPQLIEDIGLIASFDCWIGHTNFDITNDLKNKLDRAEGVEILKISSRYRFFIGIGKMFDFTEVRNNIEKILTQGA